MEKLPVSNETLEQFRSRLLEELRKKPEDYDERDLRRIEENDDWCKRFIRHKKGNMDEAIAFAKHSNKWRKEFGVNDITPEALPEEMFEGNALFPYNTDKNGAFVLMLRVKNHKKDSKTALYQKKFIVYFIEKMLFELNAETITIVFDCTDSGVSNMDLENTKFIVSIFKDLYPYLLGFILVHEMPWLFNAIWKVIKAMLPAEGVAKIKFTKGSGLTEYIEPANLPKYLGGECDYEYKYVKGKYLGEKCPPAQTRCATPTK